MHDIALIPGAGQLANSCWPLQERDDPTIFPIDYQRGFETGQRDSSRFALQQYADRVFEKIRHLDTSVDLYAHSLGVPVCMGVLARADEEAPGLIRNLIAINPGVFNGRPKFDFHRRLDYPMKLYMPPRKRVRQTTDALKRIEAVIPHYTCSVREDLQAMMESGDGAMMIPKGFDRSRIQIYYSLEDEVIPVEITQHMAKQHGIHRKGIPNHGHKLPLDDTDGTILAHIRAENP